MPQPWEDEELYSLLVEADGPAEVKESKIPRADHREPVTSEYPDYKLEETRVISVRIANDLYPNDPKFNSREEALEWAAEKYGRVLVAQYVPGRAFFRVPLKRG